MSVKNWCFTHNNYTEPDLTILRQYGERIGQRDDSLVYLVYGREVGDGGTPHLQGYLCFPSPKSFNQVRALFQPLSAAPHVEKSRGTPTQASTYCKKDNDFEEFGCLPAGHGRRTDLDRFIEWVPGQYESRGRPPSESECALAFPALFLRYRRNMLDLSTMLCPPPVFVPDGSELRDWQVELETSLDSEADDRTIRFYVDTDGGKGKSWFIRYYISKQKDAQLLGIGKRDDIAHMIDTSKRFFFFNIPRGSIEYLQYTVLEQLKDRMVVSPKYNSHVKVFPTNVHVVVMTNEEPDQSKMSADRYIITTL